MTYRIRALYWETIESALESVPVSDDDRLKRYGGIDVLRRWFYLVIRMTPFKLTALRGSRE